MIEKVGVLVPAHNEEASLAACLHALMCAGTELDIPWRIVVVLDRCSDGSRQVAHQFRAVQTIDVLAGNVGVARATGAAALLRWARPTTSNGIWLATTDADTVVPRDWLARQVQYADRGWEAFVGTVAVEDWSPRPSTARERWTASYRPVDDHDHVHGANFGCTATAYNAAGGWPPLTAHEDVALVEAMQGRRILRPARPQVVTSARDDPRARHGFGDALTELAG